MKAGIIAEGNFFLKEQLKPASFMIVTAP